MWCRLHGVASLIGIRTRLVKRCKRYEGEVPGNGTGIMDKNIVRCAVPGCACNKKRGIDNAISQLIWICELFDTRLVCILQARTGRTNPQDRARIVFFIAKRHRAKSIPIGVQNCILLHAIICKCGVRTEIIIRRRGRCFVADEIAHKAHLRASTLTSCIDCAAGNAAVASSIWRARLFGTLIAFSTSKEEPPQYQSC